MNNECYEGNILNAALLEMKKNKCCCPRYIPGPTGPTGPTASNALDAFASKYDATENTINLTASTQTVVPLTTTGVLKT